MYVLVNVYSSDVRSARVEVEIGLLHVKSENGLVITDEPEVGLTEPSVEKEVASGTNSCGRPVPEELELGECTNMLSFLILGGNNVQTVITSFIHALDSVLP